MPPVEVAVDGFNHWPEWKSDRQRCKMVGYSEDGLDFDNDSLADPDFVPELNNFEDDVPEVDIDVDSIIQTLEDDHESPGCSTEYAPSREMSDQAPPAKKPAKEKIPKLNLRWKKKNLELSELQLMSTGNKTLGSDLLELDTPIQYFFHLFSPELIKMISEETNLVTNHWSPILGTPLIQETISLNKFEKIRQSLHFNDNSKNLPREHPDHDRIYKIRPLVDSLNEAYSNIPIEEHLCVDEQMCSTKSRNTLKRYNPNKPHKWGYKVYVLSGVTGFAYKTEIETGKENVVLDGEPDLGASSNVVMRLARMIPRHQNFRLYFDNYFTSLRLLEYLAKEGILSLGTIRRNRIPDCKLSTEKLMMKKERGYSEEYVADVNGIDVSTVAWKDNKIVSLASTFAGQKPESDVQSEIQEKSTKDLLNMCLQKRYVKTKSDIGHNGLIKKSDANFQSA
ncbi:piggyBac transposable element-derived protein 4-like [Spodoptera frugiperda]|uniref:PiggyBac transposable element-derived protein 4-like n=1 Tax=Spodoptera frugiperda TaxID=7108 RepID=A0A9R0DT52_SPOFR|nr:piggyBac transposable element-derived protein 4-like [Spodoptera frugiperda]